MGPELAGDLQLRRQAVPERAGAAHLRILSRESRGIRGEGKPASTGSLESHKRLQQIGTVLKRLGVATCHSLTGRVPLPTASAFAIRRCFAAPRMPPTASAFACGSASATPPQGGSDRVLLEAMCWPQALPPGGGVGETRAPPAVEPEEANATPHSPESGSVDQPGV